MCVYMYVCVSVNVCARMHVCVYICLCVREQSPCLTMFLTHTHPHIHTHSLAHAHTLSLLQGATLYARVSVHTGDPPYRIENLTNTALSFVQHSSGDRYADPPTYT
jgi:hypothetical protein